MTARLVTGKQKNSKMCFICGLKNQYGLKASFFELDNGELVCTTQPSTFHQSYPERLHGGITAALLDETIGRAIMMRHKEMFWGVTVEFSVKYKKPIPLGQELKVVGRITNENSRFFEGTGELILANGEIAATGEGKYLKMPIGKIADFNAEEQEWRVHQSSDDPTAINY
ncbi:MAG: PaaI family thioesterase [Ignavibacteriales bacterium]|nr:PaaI family thioesterase [Ignavibacteriales bacterium]